MSAVTTPEIPAIIAGQQYALHRFNSQTDLSFDPSEYSRFKYGCKSCARKFGLSLARGFIQSELFRAVLHNLQIKNTRIVVTASPYSFIPTATFAMKDYFIKELNMELVRLGMPVVEETKMSRTTSYFVDYGLMSADERNKLIQNETFHIDWEFVNDKIVLFMDDIFITGSHERGVMKMISNKFDKCMFPGFDFLFLYYARKNDNDVNPNIENYLNYYSVKKLLDINKIIRNGEFIFNTRLVKYILSAPHEECRTFLQYQSQGFISSLAHLALGNSYHQVENCRENIEFLIQHDKELSERLGHEFI